MPFKSREAYLDYHNHYNRTRRRKQVRIDQEPLCEEAQRRCRYTGPTGGRVEQPFLPDTEDRRAEILQRLAEARFG